MTEPVLLFKCGKCHYRLVDPVMLMFRSDPAAAQKQPQSSTAQMFDDGILINHSKRHCQTNQLLLVLAFPIKEFVTYSLILGCFCAVAVYFQN